MGEVVGAVALIAVIAWHAFKEVICNASDTNDLGSH